MVLSSLDAGRTIFTHHVIEQLIQLFHDRLIRLDRDRVKHILRLDFRIRTRVDNANTIRFLAEHLSNASHHHVERYVAHFLFLCVTVLLCHHYTYIIVQRQYPTVENFPYIFVRFLRANIVPIVVSRYLSSTYVKLGRPASP